MHLDLRLCIHLFHHSPMTIPCAPDIAGRNRRAREEGHLSDGQVTLLPATQRRAVVRSWRAVNSAAWHRWREAVPCDLLHWPDCALAPAPE